MSITERVEALAYRVLNPVVKGLLRSPLHGLASKNVTLLHFTGRNSGKQYVTPLSYVRDDHTIWLLSGHTTRWWKNLRGNQSTVSLEIARKTYRGTAQLWEHDSEELRTYARRYLTALPRDAKVYGIQLDADKRPVETSLAEVAPHLVFVQVQLDAEDSTE